MPCVGVDDLREILCWSRAIASQLGGGATGSVPFHRARERCAEHETEPCPSMPKHRTEHYGRSAMEDSINWDSLHNGGEQYEDHQPFLVRFTYKEVFVKSRKFEEHWIANKE